MQTAKHILSALLIASLLVAGLPLFNPDDATQPNSVLLADAILSAQALSRSTQHTGSSEAEIKKALSSLSVAAGLKTTIQTDNHDESVLAFSLSDSPFLIASSCLPVSTPYNESIYNLNISYQSFLCNLTSPPPRTVWMAAEQLKTSHLKLYTYKGEPWNQKYL